MIVLDTNVISEVMRGEGADQTVLRWLDALAEPPVTTVINRAEILAGLALLPPGARRDGLKVAAEVAFSVLGVVLPLTSEAAENFAAVMGARTRLGRSIAAMDALVAAICLTAGATLATRDVRDFDGLGLEVINPWA